MNREEYMQALETALQFLPKEARAAALDFYGEMIDDRMEDGMDEVSAVAAMERPEEIAARLRAENPGFGTEEPESDGTAHRDAPESARPIRDDAMEFSALAERVKQSVSQALGDVPDLVNAGMERAGEAMAQAAKAVDEARQETGSPAESMEPGKAWFQEEEAEGEYTRKTFTCTAAQVRSIRLHAVDMPIRIVPCEGDQITLCYCTSARNPYTLTLENGVLTLMHPDQALFRGGFSMERLGGLFRIAWSSPTPTIRLAMPPDVLLDLLAHTSNGSIKAGGFATLCAVDLQTSNSRIELENTACKSLELKSSNGRLVLREVASKRRMQCKTSNSRIEAEHVRCAEGMTLHTSNGRIQAKELTAAGELELKTSNSSLAVEDVQGAQVILKTSNGSISGVLPGSQADWAIDSGTSNGHNSLPASQPGDRPLSVHTSNGSISLRFRKP